MVATQNIDTLGPIWTFSLKGVLTFVDSSLNINGCVELFWGQQIYTVIKAVHSLIYIVAKCNFFSVGITWKYIIKFTKMEGCTHFCEILYNVIITADNIYGTDILMYVGGLVNPFDQLVWYYKLMWKLDCNNRVYQCRSWKETISKAQTGQLKGSYSDAVLWTLIEAVALWVFFHQYEPVPASPLWKCPCSTGSDELQSLSRGPWIKGFYLCVRWSSSD